MSRINKDVIVALCLLLACGVFIASSFQIREPDYGVLSPATWPRAILVAMTVLSLIYLFQSIKAGPAQPNEEELALIAERKRVGFFGYWRNVIVCFVLFFLYLLTMPWLGMLLGGLAFVFLLLNVLGGWSPKLLALHALIAVCTVGGMWLLFTFGLDVNLPAGEIIRRF